MSNLAERCELILMALGDQGPITVRDLAAEIGATPTQVYQAVYLLEHAGQVKRTREVPARCVLIERNATDTADVAEDPMSERIPNWPNSRCTSEGRPGIILKCSTAECPNNWSVELAMPPSAIRQKAGAQGWTIAKKFKSASCPECAAKPAISATEDEPMNPKNDTQKRLFRQVMTLLEEHYDEPNKCYEDGWSDAKIAGELEVSTEFVAKIRDDFFGPAEDSRIGDLRVEITTVRTELAKAKVASKAEITELRVMVGDAESKWTSTLDDLTRKLDDLGRRLAQITGRK